MLPGLTSLKMGRLKEAVRGPEGPAAPRSDTVSTTLNFQEDPSL